MQTYLSPDHYLPPQIEPPSSSTQGIMTEVLIALLPALGMSVFLFGPRVLLLCLVSIASCVGFEALYCKLTHQNITIGDRSACVTGLLLAMSLPASAPYWTPALGGAFAIVVVKKFYGGLGKNFMNPALAGRMLLATFPILMTTWSMPLDRLALLSPDAVSSATPMSYLSAGVLPPQSISELLLGYQGGCFGEVSSFLLILGGVYLILRHVIAPTIPLAYLGTAALIALLFSPSGISPLSWLFAQLFSGGLIFGAFFMATDPVTSPITPKGQLAYGVCCGLLTMLLRYHGSYPEGVGWAILTMNSCVWLFDRVGTPRRFGDAPFSTLRSMDKKLRSELADIQFVKPDFTKLRNSHKKGMAPGEAHLDWIRAQSRRLLPLGGLALSMGFLIFGVHHATSLHSAQSETQAQQKLLRQVMPEASFSSEAPYYISGALDIQSAFGSENELLGYCVEVQSHGFNGMITMVVGVDLDGKVTGVAITDHQETLSVVKPALSAVNLRRYIGRSGTLRNTGSNSVDTISGATATSKAITAGVNRALAIVARLDTQTEVTFEESETLE